MKIICIGRNYAEHAKELNNAVPTEPIFFLKPDVALLKEGGDFYFPSFTKDIHYECEIVIRIDKVGKHIAEKFASKYYTSFTLGLDLTARDLQQKCKEKGMPWEIAKAFEHSAPIADQFLPTEKYNLKDLHFSLLQNGKKVQNGHTADMLFDVDQIIAYVSQFFTLKTGDLIYTGTPAGVGPIQIGDKLEGFIEEQKMFEFHIK
jgi:2-keto-4-pentenoate hydratase/2-oxohepta-3-ene-1,7-dioic acid hydratase in catechol pathway